MRKSVVAIAIVAGLALSGTARATPMNLSFGISGFGNYSVDTGDISATTTTKTIPGLELINGIAPADAANAATAGIVVGDPVTFSTSTFNTVDGADAFTLGAGDLTFTFANVTNASLVATTGTSPGSLSELFTGTVTGDTSVGSGFLGQTVSLSETCTQVGPGQDISCTDSVTTPSAATPVPEPSTLALIGAALLGLGMLRRRSTL